MIHSRLHSGPRRIGIVRKPEDSMENPGHLLQRIELSRTTLWLHHFNRTLYSFDLENRKFHKENPPFSSALDDFFLLPDGRVLAAKEKRRYLGQYLWKLGISDRNTVFRFIER